MTAVEFLKDFMWMKDHHYFLEGDLALAFSKAELMEKEQREKDFKAGNDSACMEHEDIKDYFDKYIKSE